MQEALVTIHARQRPSRAQIEPAALALVSRHSAGLLATARRYSLTPEDAEDAYQRGMEILLTKAPTTREDELLPWLKTVVKHEAFAVRASTAKALPRATAREAEAITWTDERAERFERLRLGAEAMAHLKPHEVRCLLLRAEGLSYQEICDVTSWSYTKVNRCITEGRRAFLARVASIESGVECQRLAPLISKAADGEASPDEMRRVRPHLKSCLACKATLREYRAAPAGLAALVPPVFAMTAGGGGGFVARLLAMVQTRFTGIGEAATAQKAAAIAASAAVLAGGGAAGSGAMHHDAPPIARDAFGGAAVEKQVTKRLHVDAAAQPASPAASDPAPVTPAASTFVGQPAASGAGDAPAPDAATDEPVPEFDPGAAPSPGGSAAQSQTASAKGQGSAQPQATPGGSGEFGP